MTRFRKAILESTKKGGVDIHWVSCNEELTIGAEKESPSSNLSSLWVLVHETATSQAYKSHHRWRMSLQASQGLNFYFYFIHFNFIYFQNQTQVCLFALFHYFSFSRLV